MKVGDYVRTKSNGIQKIDEEGRINLGLIRPPFHIIKEEELLKSSPNIIDLIEVGDIVTTNNLCGEITKIDGDKIYTTCYDGEYCSIEDIKSIVTKEQFERCEYKCE